MNPFPVLEEAVSNAGPRHSWRTYAPLLSIMLLALVLRAGCALFLTGTIDTEGAEYARIAENLVHGRGYIGIATPGKELMFPPLFPFLIAALTLVTHDAEYAGRLVSVLLGTLLTVPVYFIGRHLYSRPVALLSATLIACHPLLINFSATLYCETTYVTLLLTAVYWSLRAFQRQNAGSFAAGGLFFGLAYLTRPEAMVYPFVVVVLAFLWSRIRERQFHLSATLWMPAISLLLAIPYILWLHGETGQWRIEGKSPLNYTTARRMQIGEDPYEAQYAVGPDLRERGVWIQSNLETIRSTRFTAREFVSYLRAKSREVLTFPKDSISGSLVLGSPPLFAFAVLGLFRRRWNPETIVDQFFLCTVIGVACGALFGIYYLSLRFLLVLLPVFIVWASNGIAAMAVWGRSMVGVVNGGRGSRGAAVGVAAVLSAVIPVLSVMTISEAYEIRASNRSSRPIRMAGAWLDAYAPGSKTVVDVTTSMAFHANAEFIPFPYCSPETALRYFDKRNVDFIILKDPEVPSRPYLKEWMENGIPSARARLIYRTQAPVTGRILIYRWDRGGAGQDATPDSRRVSSADRPRPAPSVAQHPPVAPL